MPARPDTILFDLGVVLLHLQYERAIARALPLCDPARVGAGAGFLTLLDRTHHVHDYESGRITAFDFYQAFVAATGFRESFEVFADLWRGIFAENEPMIAFANELAARYPCYFLTNASDLHVPWVFERYPGLRFLRGYHCSCYAGVMKPDPAFYTGALQRFGLRPEQCLFIDDRPENVETARALGISSVLYTDSTDAIAQVRRALI